MVNHNMINPVAKIKLQSYYDKNLLSLKLYIARYIDRIANIYNPS